MAVMPERRDTEEPDAGRGKEPAAGALHEDIVARLLEYRRRLQEEIGDEPASLGEELGDEPAAFGEEFDEPPSVQDEHVHAEPDAVFEEVPSEREAEPEPTPRPPHEASSEPPDARQLKERIHRIDETLARISSMLPLLRGGDDRGEDDPDPKT